MASPFRLNKKERKRSRKFVKSIQSNLRKWEEANPEAAASLKRIAELETKIGTAKQRKKKVNASTNG
jgi:hypothetical protein